MITRNLSERTINCGIETLEQRKTLIDEFNKSIITTGVPKIDLVFNGMRRGCLYSICAGTGVGKSTILLATAKSMARQGKKVLYLSIEMSIEMMAQYCLDDEPNLTICEFNDTSEDWQGLRLIVEDYDIICYDYLGAILEDWNQLIIKTDALANTARTWNITILTANQMNTAEFSKDEANPKLNVEDSLHTTQYIAYAKGMATKLSGGAYLVRRGTNLYLYAFKNRYGVLTKEPQLIDTLDYKKKEWKEEKAYKVPDLRSYKFEKV